MSVQYVRNISLYKSGVVIIHPQCEPPAQQTSLNICTPHTYKNKHVSCLLWLLVRIFHYWYVKTNMLGWLLLSSCSWTTKSTRVPYDIKVLGIWQFLGRWYGDLSKLCLVLGISATLYQGGWVIEPLIYKFVSDVSFYSMKRIPKRFWVASCKTCKHIRKIINFVNNRNFRVKYWYLWNCYQYQYPDFEVPKEIFQIFFHIKSNVLQILSKFFQSQNSIL